METPFVFGKIASDANFTDREKETAHLVTNFNSLINTIIVSPRRWGKSSLVHKASDVAEKENDNIRICHIDLFNVRDEEHFYSLFSESVIKVTSSRWDEAVSDAKKFFTRVIPKVVVGNDPTSEVSLQFNWEDLKRNPDDVLDLAENIAREKGLKIVVCIDEFQNVSSFINPLFFQKCLRSHWQLHHKVSYCLYGSKRHMMLDIFTNPSMPFYKFGDLIFLDKIETPYLTSFIHERFLSSGKTIAADACLKIVELTDNHPYYVQQLAQLSWLRTDKVCSVDTVIEAHASLVEQLSLLFVTITEGLTSQQLNYLKALLSGEKSISSTKVMNKYGITSYTSVSRSRNTLVQSDILDNKAGDISFQDPIYAFWLKKYYFAV